MTDLVKRLCACCGIQSGDPECYCAEAAAEIERLRGERDQFLEQIALRQDNRWAAEIEEQHAELERLRTALQPFANEYDKLMQQPDSFPAWHSISTTHLRAARAALENKP
jgi:DNA repair exonuclease SbcCD ATPase subunit